MPATSGRVRMPHNNRVSTSKALNTSDIWSKTIGHDPYAGAEDQSADKASEDKARGLLELARHQNLTGGRNASGNDDFARKMFLGLKGGKKRASDLNDSAGGNLDADTRALLEEESSSSEEEFVQVKPDNTPTADGANLKGGESDASSDEDDDSSREERRRRKRKREKKRSKSKSHKRKKLEKKHRRRRDYSSSSDSDDSSSSTSSEEERHRRKRRHKRKHERDRDRKRRHKSDDRDRKR